MRKSDESVEDEQETLAQFLRANALNICVGVVSSLGAVVLSAYIVILSLRASGAGLQLVIPVWVWVGLVLSIGVLIVRVFRVGRND